MAPIAHQSHKQNYEKYRLQPNKTAEIVVEGYKRRHKKRGPSLATAHAFGLYGDVRSVMWRGGRRMAERPLGRLVGAVGLAGAYGYDLGGLLLVALKREDVVNVDGVLRVYDVGRHEAKGLQLVAAEREELDDARRLCRHRPARPGEP